LVVALAVATLAVAALGREPDFREYRAVRESLSAVHPRFREYWLNARGHDVDDFIPMRKPSADSTGLRLIGKYGRGPSVAVTGSDTLVALTLGSEVALINFANPDQPQVVSEIQLDFMPAQSVLAGSLLITGGRGMDIWSIADPAHPTRISRFPIGAGDFCVNDSLVCFIQTDTFRVFSIGDPANPRQLGTYRDSGYVFSVSGNTVVAGHPSIGLFFVDISDPARPQKVGTFPSDYPLAAQARGNLCCASFERNVEPYPIRFVTLDISNPASVRQLARIDSAGGYDIYLWDTLAFASGRDRAYAEEFQIISIADSAHPRLLSRGKTPYDNWGVWACPPRRRAYVADHSKGMSVFDITNLANPVRDTGIMVADLAYDVAVDGNRAYVANWVGGLRVLDVTDPVLPVEAGGRDSTESTCWTVAAKDSYAFIGWRPNPYFRSILVSNPALPQQVGSGLVQTIPEDMILRDTLVYLAGNLRFNVVNVARPRSPVLVGTCNLPDDAAGVWLQDTLAYVAYWPMSVINVANPRSPTVVGQIWEGCWNVVVRDTVAFLASSVLAWYSVANPAVPYPIDSLSLGRTVYGLAVNDTLVYAATLDDKVYAVSIADLHAPHVVGQSVVPDLVWRFESSPPYLYAACLGGGVSIFDTETTGVGEGSSVPLPANGTPFASSPVRGRVTVEVPNIAREEVMCNAYTVAGIRVPATVSFLAGDGCTSLKLDLRSVSAGIYLLRIRVGNIVYPLRITKL